MLFKKKEERVKIREKIRKNILIKKVGKEELCLILKRQNKLIL